MGIAERKAREKEALRRRIIDAARKMFVEDGFEKTTLRKIAKAIEYSVGTIYLYFQNKDELFFAIHEEAFHLLHEKMDATMHIDHPVERLRTMGEAYLQFAFQYPEYYDLMFILDAPMNAIETHLCEAQAAGLDLSQTQEWAAVLGAFGCLYQTVQDCIDQGYFVSKDLHTTTFQIWSTMHGMISLYIRKRLKMYPEESHMNLIRQGMEQTLRQLQAA